jgi:hypothetical protein
MNKHHTAHYVIAMLLAAISVVALVAVWRLPAPTHTHSFGFGEAVPK